MDQKIHFLSVCRLTILLYQTITVVSSANFRSFTDRSAEGLSCVYREKRRGERTHPWWAPVLTVLLQEKMLTCCSVMKLMIHGRVEVEHRELGELLMEDVWADGAEGHNSTRDDGGALEAGGNLTQLQTS